MAHLALTDRPVALQPCHDPVGPATTHRLSALEWSVVALARGEHPNSLREPSRLGRAVGGLFGRATKSRLADDRLETLRRLAIHAWHHGYQLPVSEIKTFLRSGFSPEQLDAVLTSISTARASSRRRAIA